MHEGAGGASRPTGARLALVRAALAAALLGAGCAVVEPPPEPQRQPSVAAPAGDPEWWSVRVRMGFDRLEAVDWSLDALLADRIFAPILDRLEPALVLWRFHRRAAPDAAGHQLSFIFYADGEVAARVAAAVRASALIDALRGRGLVSEVLLPDSAAGLGRALAATSDRGWPPAIQDSWPHFAMGVSRHWLELIARLRSSQADPPPRETDALLERYRAISEEVDALWRDHAQHAYLHHLNALFGYRPLLIQERRLMRF